MTEWEQIRKEYREIPVPAEGLPQMLEAMADAKRKRSRFKNFARYGTVAAAVLLVVLLVPGVMLFSGGFSTAEDSAYVESDFVAQKNGSEGGWFMRDTAMNMAPVADSAPTTESAYDTATNTGAGDNAETVTEQKKDADVIWAGKEEAISKEILKQMEERMGENGETYYIRSEEYPEGFELISEEQEYYINEAGLLVIVFRAGTVAPQEQGTVEFIIPAEVVSP